MCSVLRGEIVEKTRTAIKSEMNLLSGLIIFRACWRGAGRSCFLGSGGSGSGGDGSGSGSGGGGGSGGGSGSFSAGCGGGVDGRVGYGSWLRLEKR